MVPYSKFVSTSSLARGLSLVRILLFASVRVAAQKQPVKFEHLNPEHGLSNGTVVSILQDRQGFMWFGTFDGLNKYDSYNFTIYKHDPANPKSLSDNNISSLCEGDADRSSSQASSAAKSEARPSKGVG